MAMGSRVHNRFALLGFALLSIVGACSLNPQPIPPGAQATATDAGGFGSKAAEDPNAADTGNRVGDGGETLTSDASATPDDAGTNDGDADVVVIVDGGVDADVDDATNDALADAPEDGAGD